MVNITGSFVSPSADATVSPQLIASAGFLAAVLEGLTVWKALGTLFLAAVIYDQCECDFAPESRIAYRLHVANNANRFRSQIPLLQGFYHWSLLQDPLHGPVPAIRQPQVHRVQGQMGQRRAQLCLRFPQVSNPRQIRPPMSIQLSILYMGFR